MLNVHDHILAYGQSSLLINSITIVFSLLVSPGVVAKADETVESDDIYSSEEYDSEDYEDKAKIDIRPLRDSRKQIKPVSNTEFTAPLQTTTATSTTGAEPVTSEAVYTGTFKNVHNRKDYNYSLFTLPTVIGTLFTVNLEEWKRTQTDRMTIRPVKLLDPAMLKYFSPRTNHTDVKEYRRFVHWANRQYRKNQTKGTTSLYRAQSNWTLYPKEFENDTAFQDYMAKNWVNTSAYNYRSSRWKNGSAPHRPRPWIDRIASREFHSRPWRNRNVSEIRPSRRNWTQKAYYWAVEGNETVAKELPGRFASRRRHPLYDSRETGARFWRDDPMYYKPGEQNQTTEFKQRRWREPKYWPAAGNETERVDIGARPWRRRPYHWGAEENGTTRFSSLRGPRYWPEGVNASLYDKFDRIPMREYPPYRHWSREYYRDSREFSERYNQSGDFERRAWQERPPPLDRRPPPWAERYDHREFGPPRMREFAPPRRPDFEPKERMDRRDSMEYDSKYLPDSRELRRRPPIDRSYSKELDDRPLPRRDEIDEKQPRGLDRPDRKEFDDRWSREKDLDDQEPRTRPAFVDRSEKSKELDDRRYSEDRWRFKDRPPKGRDFDDRRPSEREKFEDRQGRRRDFDDRRPFRDREKVEDRPGRGRDLDDRRPSQDREKFEDRSGRGKDIDERKPPQSSRESDAKSWEDKYLDKQKAQSEDRLSSEDSSDTSPRSKFGYTSSIREFDSNKTDKVLSIKRSGKDFWDERKRKIEGHKGHPKTATKTTLDPIALQAIFYRKRIEQRREKELNLLEKKRRIFWKPTASGEATEADGMTTTTIKTSTRRSYNKMNKFFAKFSQAPNFTLEETLETPTEKPVGEEGQAQEETSPYDEKYSKYLAARRERDKLTIGMYNWITTSGKTTDVGITNRMEGEDSEENTRKSLAEPKVTRSGDSKQASGKKKSAGSAKNKNKGSNKKGKKQ